MAYRSWLKDVRKLDDLGSGLHRFPRHHQDWDREWELEKRQISQIENPFRPAALDPSSYRYFEGWLHDGYVSSAIRTVDRLELTINNETLMLFCNEYFAELDEDWEPVLSPVRLVFEGANYVNAVRADTEGWLKWDDWEQWRPLDDLRSADTFLRGRFTEQDGQIQWIGQFHKWPERGKLDSNLFLLVDCERASAKPEPERALRKRIGDQAFEVWSHFESLPPGEPWSDHGYLRRFLAEKGIPIRRIPHQSER